MNEIVPTQVTVCDRAGDPIDDLRLKAKAAWRGQRDSGWDFAVYVAEICTADRWRGWGFKTMRDWIEIDFPGEDVPNVSHYKTIGQWLLALPQWEQDQWRLTPIWKAIDGKALLGEESSRHKLLEDISNGMTNAEIRKQVAKTKPDLHLEDEWRTINLKVPLPVYERWERALNATRYLLSNANPSPSDLIECIAQDVISDEWILTMDHARMDTILDGNYRCRECGSWDANNLEHHHVIPRSHGGHEGPQVLLCHACHGMVTRNEGGTWRDYAKKWGIEVPDGS